MEKVFDIAVIGLGALGSSALWHLSRSGKRILGIDQFAPPHHLGSSHGESRITRLAVGEGMDFVPLVKRSHVLWREIEKLTGTAIMTTTGGLLFDSGVTAWSKHGSEGFFDRTVKFAKEGEIPHEVFEGKCLPRQFQQFNLEEGGRVYYEPSAGFLRPETAIRTQLTLAEHHKSVIKTHLQVHHLKPTGGGGVQIHTSHGTFESEKVLVSAGAWVKDFLPPDKRFEFKICRQVLHWIPVKGEAYALGKSPVFMWGYGPESEDFIYGFPSLDGKTIKVASESFVPSNHPNFVSREVSVEEQEAFMAEKIGKRLSHIGEKVVRSQVCLYTVTPSANFVIDQMPEFPAVWVASACSGHGFKHSAALGEAISRRLLDLNSIVDLNPFQWPTE